MDPALRFDVLSLFPKTVEGFAEESILGRAVERGLIEINSLDLRRWAKGKHRETDDRPFGGGAGMVLKPEPLFDAIEEISSEPTKVIYMAPDGEPLSPSIAKELALEKHLCLSGITRELINGYETSWLTGKCIGDYVLTNGSLAASVLIDSVVRLFRMFWGTWIP